jgi:hypothetical protein
MKLFKSCSTIPVKNFFQVIETEDLRYLIKKFDIENSKLELSNDDIVNLSLIWEEIYFEYYEITSNHKLKSILKKQCLIQEWETIYYIVSKCIDIFDTYGKEEALYLINNLNDKKYTIDFNKPLGLQLNKLDNKMKGLKNKIKIFKIKLVNSVKEDKEEVKSNLERDALYLERNLDLKRAINVSKTPIKVWVEMIDLSKQKAKEYGKDRHK